MKFSPVKKPHIKNVVGILLPFENDIPKEFWDRFNNKYSKIASHWFFVGMDKKQESELHAKQGIDKTEGLDHIFTILTSFEPSHEHKIAGCGYLISLWFDI